MFFDALWHSQNSKNKHIQNQKLIYFVQIGERCQECKQPSVGLLGRGTFYSRIQTVSCFEIGNFRKKYLFLFFLILFWTRKSTVCKHQNVGQETSASTGLLWRVFSVRKHSECNFSNKKILFCRFSKNKSWREAHTPAVSRRIITQQAAYLGELRTLLWLILWISKLIRFMKKTLRFSKFPKSWPERKPTEKVRKPLSMFSDRRTSRFDWLSLTHSVLAAGLVFWAKGLHGVSDEAFLLSVSSFSNSPASRQDFISDFRNNHRIQPVQFWLKNRCVRLSEAVWKTGKNDAYFSFSIGNSSVEDLVAGSVLKNMQ